MTDLTGLQPTVALDAPEPTITSAAAMEAASRASRGSRLWALAVLSIVAFLAAIDRQAFSVLLVPIQKDLHVSDAAMGMLTGSAFAIVYAVIALPIARLADRTNRRTMLALAVAVWSTATVVCGFTSRFAQILLARIVVGSAESAQSPASMSLIGDLATPQKRGTAIAVTVLGSALGFAAGSALAGALSDRYSWHVAMMVVGGPGLLVAALLYLTVKEPARGAQEGSGQVVTAKENIWECLRRCARIRTLYPFAAGWICLQISFAGWLTWIPAFLMRVHHLSATRMGAVFGSIIACSIVGVALSGPLSDFVARRGARWRLYYCGLCATISVPILAASTLVPTLAETTTLLIIYTLCSGGLTAVGSAVYVSIAPPTMRGFITAVMGLAAALLGAGSAPVLYGAVNDVLKKTLGDESLRYTLLLSPLALAMAAVFFLLASRTADQDVEAAGQTSTAV